MKAPHKSMKRCPICGKPAAPQHRPFCSRGCADIDLNRWLSGRYVIAASEEAPGRQDAENADAGDEERN